MKTRLIIALIILTFHSLAQQATTASGGDAIGNGGSIAYSIGQITGNTITFRTGSVEQGVQHAYEIYLNTPTDSISSLIVYPNPTKDVLVLSIGNYKHEQLSYYLYDIQGKLLEFSTISEENTQISMKLLPVSTYILSIVSSEDKRVQSYRIIKN